MFRHRRLPLIAGLLCYMAGPHRFNHGSHGPWGAPGFGRGPFGGPGAGRRFGRGDLKYVILDLLQDEPRHGYDVIRALEDRFHGFYSPSPGSVYPTLQLLEDQGYVTSTQQDGKRVYAITDAGRAFLQEQSEAVETARSRMRGPWMVKGSPEMRELMHEVAGIGQLLFREGAHGGLNDSDRIGRLRGIVARTRSEIEALFADSPSPDHIV